ncbi:MAG: multicopper oxidase domain-containing protein, partial [Desulfobacterales bacterium]|nr:multicopper oxidase domain-containing protein [Desulfobacterales bacterium]
MKRSMLTTAILGILGLSSTFTVLAANDTVALCAGQFDKPLPTATNPEVTVPMWGYALGGASEGVCDGTLSSPGPRIKVGNNSTGVDITLTNTLPRATSLIIPGTVKGMAPVFFEGPQGLRRVHSFDAEAAANGGTVTYNWNNLKPGSYMYHSGTHPQVQVQMGLFGALTDDHVAGQAYDDVSTAYTQEIILFYYEIDRAIHEGVAQGDYNTTDMKSTIDYHPKHFFIDIDSNYSGGPNESVNYNDLPAVKVLPGIDPLVRFYNAGLRTHIPTLYEADFDIIAEDGKLYPKVIEQYTVVL